MKTPLGFHASAAGTAPRFLVPSAAGELGIVLALSVLFPFLIHLLPVPQDARLGARLLPIFYAPLLATLLGRMPTAWAVALAAPWLNWLFTRYPSPPGALLLMLQLVVFVGVLSALMRRTGPRWYLAAPAYFAGLAIAVLVAAIFPTLIGGRAALTWAAQGLAIGWPGIVILVLINALVAQTPFAGGGRGAAA